MWALDGWSLGKKPQGFTGRRMQHPTSGQHKREVAGARSLQVQQRRKPAFLTPCLHLLLHIGGCGHQLGKQNHREEKEVETGRGGGGQEGSTLLFPS